MDFENKISTQRSIIQTKTQNILSEILNTYLIEKLVSVAITYYLK